MFWYRPNGQVWLESLSVGWNGHIWLGKSALKHDGIYEFDCNSLSAGSNGHDWLRQSLLKYGRVAKFDRNPFGVGANGQKDARLDSYTS